MNRRRGSRAKRACRSFFKLLPACCPPSHLCLLCGSRKYTGRPSVTPLHTTVRTVSEPQGTLTSQICASSCTAVYLQGRGVRMDEQKCGMSQVWEDHGAHSFGALAHADLTDLRQLLHRCVPARGRG